MTSPPGITTKLQAEPRWPAVLAVVAIGLLYLLLPERLTLGPNWTLLVVIFLLLIPSLITHRMGNIRVSSLLGLALSSFTTLALLWPLASLIVGLPKHRESLAVLLQAAAALWISNILVFASWYWRLDAGGPHARDLRVICSAVHKTHAVRFISLRSADSDDRLAASACGGRACRILAGTARNQSGSDGCAAAGIGRLNSLMPSQSRDNR
jgi:hypothetical protein